VDASLSGVSVDADVSASKDGRRLQGLVAAKLAMIPKADLDVVSNALLLLLLLLCCTNSIVQADC
jgi:hypothetical protein